MSTFDYDEMVTRNLGFISQQEQERLRSSHVFIPGAGGMGSAAAAALARVGVGRMTLVDPDRFETSNLNRQMFADSRSIGRFKAEVARERIHDINPRCEIMVSTSEAWTGRLGEVLSDVDVAVNGCDDVLATLSLMRASAARGITVVDAYPSSLPNVFVVAPHDRRPEERLGFPSVGRPLASLTSDDVRACQLRELEFVLASSRTLEYLDTDEVRGVVSEARPRMSFAPIVWMTASWMAHEAIRVLLGRRGGPGPEGRFFNPWTSEVERPRRGLTGFVRRRRARLALARMGSAA